MLGDLVQSIKTAALDAMNNSGPTCIMYGKVIQTSPLKIQVNVKLILEEQQLVLTRNVTDFETSVSIDWETESALGKHHHSGSGLSDSLGGSVSGDTEDTGLSHIHKIMGTKPIIVHNGLHVGEEVILIRQSGGQEYIVLDRVGS